MTSLSCCLTLNIHDGQSIGHLRNSIFLSYMSRLFFYSKDKYSAFKFDGCIICAKHHLHQYFSYIVAATIIGGQYFSYIVAATIIGGGNWNTSRKLILSLKTALNTLCHTRRENIEPTTYVVIGPDCIGRWNSNYYHSWPQQPPSESIVPIDL